MRQRSEIPPAHEQGESGQLTDADIAFLCDIGASDSFAAEAGAMRRLDRLVTLGFLAPAGPGQGPAKYQLTARAQQMLSERGAGLNEA